MVDLILGASGVKHLSEFILLGGVILAEFGLGVRSNGCWMRLLLDVFRLDNFHDRIFRIVTRSNTKKYLEFGRQFLLQDSVWNRRWFCCVAVFGQLLFEMGDPLLN